MNEDCIAISYPCVPAYRLTDDIGSEGRDVPPGLRMHGVSMVTLYLFSICLVLLGKNRWSASRLAARNKITGEEKVGVYDAQRSQCSRRWLPS